LITKLSNHNFFYMENEIKKVLIASILEAGKIARQGFHSNYQVGWKHRHDPVTPTDLKINKYLVGKIKKHYPGHNVISEELPVEMHNSAYSWYIDPIDGTIPFSQGIPFFCISVGVAKNDKMLFAAVLDPIHNELFFSQKGKGTYLNGRKIMSASRQKLADAYIDFAVWKSAPYKLIDFMNYLNKLCYVSAHHACLVLSSCYVVAGRMDAAIFAGSTPWDVATISLICEEAGVKCTNLDGSVWQPGRNPIGMIAARPKLHQELLKRVKRKVKL